MNPESLETLPLVIMTWALASTRVPSAKALKEAILPKPTETSAPKPKLPAILAQNLEPGSKEKIHLYIGTMIGKIFKVLLNNKNPKNNKKIII